MDRIGKKLLALLLALILAFTFCACGTKTENQVSEEELEKEIEKEREEELKNDPTSELKLTLDEWPVIDGATAMLPYYEEAAARILDLPIEEARLHVLCNTTSEAYANLSNRTADLIFCAPPSDEQIEYAASVGVTFESTQILNSGFVFFVNKDNPVNSLTIQQLYDIYAGNITNWKEVGGDDEEIIAYQRSEGSGSQSGLYQHLIPENEVMQAPTEKKIGAMAEIVDAVADYDNAKQAIGYSYYYYITNMHYQEEVKLLAIDNIYPTTETISSGMYPFISETSAYFRSDEPEDSAVRKIAAWCSGAAGNILAEDLGYVPSKTSKTVIPSYAKVQPTYGEWNVVKANNITLTTVDCSLDYMDEYSTACYYQVEGLKDTKVQDKINARIKEVVDGYLSNTYVPKYRGAALKDQTGLLCRGLWCNECFNASNILSITVYAGFSTADYESYFAETKGLTFDLNTGEEIAIADLFDKKTDGIGYINNVIYEELNHESSDYDYYSDIVQAAPFTGINDNQNYCLDMEYGSLSIIFDADTPAIYTSYSPTYFDIDLQGYFNYDKYLSKKSLFTDETENYVFLRRSLGIGQVSDMSLNEDIVGDRNITAYWTSFMSYDGADKLVNDMVSGNQAKLDKITSMAAAAYDERSDGATYIECGILADGSLLKYGPFYNASETYTYSLYYAYNFDDTSYDSATMSDSICMLEGGSGPLELKDIFKDGVDINAVLKEAMYKALENYNKDNTFIEEGSVEPIDLTNPKLDEYISFLADDIKSFSVGSRSISLVYNSDPGTLASEMLNEPDDWANYESALYDLGFTEIGTENLCIFSDYL